MELTYTQCGDYLIPNLVLADTQEYYIGKYGRMRRAYLKEYRPVLYSTLLLTEKLFPHLAEIDAVCKKLAEKKEEPLDSFCLAAWLEKFRLYSLRPLW